MSNNKDVIVEHEGFSHAHGLPCEDCDDPVSNNCLDCDGDGVGTPPGTRIGAPLMSDPTAPQPENAEKEEGVHWAILSTLRQHRYDIHDRASKPTDPGWHACSCGWEGYWSDWHPHVADRIRALFPDDILALL